MNSLPAFKYLIEERKLTEDTIRKFHLGYIDSRGMVYIGADFDKTLPQIDFRFYNSSLFPIQSVYGDVIGVSCRPLVAKPDIPKYINSSYEKAENLYGLNITLNDVIKEKKVYVVEGNISMLQMYQGGIKNVVAMLGSNFSISQLCILLGFVEKIVFVPDGDMAGLNFMEKTKNTLLKRYKDVPLTFSFKMLPTGDDPDDFFKKHTKEEFLALPEVNV